MIFSTSGTLGDTFVTLTKLWSLAQDNDITVNHYTLHPNWHAKIKKIYSLAPRITVNFVDERDLDNPRIHSDFNSGDDVEATAFPKFKLPTMPMPSRYIAVNERSGKAHEEGRTIPAGDVHKICETHKQSVVLLGSSTTSKHDHPYIFDMTGQTSLLEAFSIVAGAEEFYGFQGVLAFFAISQKVPSTIYCRDKADVMSVAIRVQPEQRLYLKEIIV